MFGQKLRIDKAAETTLEQTAGHLAKHLSSFEKNGAGLVFPAPFPEGSPARTALDKGIVTEVRLAQKKDKKFLGGVYGTVLSAVVKTDTTCALPITMRYSGKMVKGTPSFSAKGGAECDLVHRLNADQTLLELLLEQDLEFLKIEAEDDGLLRVSMRPYGACFVYMVLPPMKYSVRLKPGHADKMAESLERIIDIMTNLDKSADTA